MMKRLFVSLLVYVLVSYQGLVGGPFPSYTECWRYRVDHGLSGSCVPLWASGTAYTSAAVKKA